MSKYCDRSPCDGMLEALGRWILGSTDGGYKALTGYSNQTSRKLKAIPVPIHYCPFCGTRLEQLELRSVGLISI